MAAFLGDARVVQPQSLTRPPVLRVSRRDYEQRKEQERQKQAEVPPEEREFPEGTVISVTNLPATCSRETLKVRRRALARTRR